MAPTKKSLSPFVGKAKLHVHTGKGALQTSDQKPSRADVAQLTGGSPGANSVNNYAKQTPMAQPSDAGTMPGLGSGDFSGLGS